MLTLKYYQDKIEAGCDEAGRGCLAGPVFAAAVILPEDFSNEMLNDSKQLSEKKREELRTIIERDSLAWAVASVDNNEIDKINILNASIEGMHRALAQLKITPEHILIEPIQTLPEYRTPLYRKRGREIHGYRGSLHSGQNTPGRIHEKIA